ncbi:MAG: TlpA family protein disulfide reductase [Flavobacteriaceae bacterium]|nr:redoxin domain-containing protein [Psychroflexus sp.]
MADWLKNFTKIKDLDLQDSPLKADLFKGKTTLILFYNNDCLGCTGRAIPFAYELKEEYGIQVILIHSNFSFSVTRKEIKSIFATPKIPLEIYIDENHFAYDQFKCEGTPHWLIIDKDMNITQSIFGSQPNAQNRIIYSLAEMKTQ